MRERLGGGLCVLCVFTGGQAEVFGAEEQRPAGC